MSDVATGTLEREKEKLWLTDAELIRRMGVPEKIARAQLRELDRKPSGFPRKQASWGNRRYWPAVQAYFDRVYSAPLSPNKGDRRENR
jgi:hypothetical protein